MDRRAWRLWMTAIGVGCLSAVAPAGEPPRVGPAEGDPVAFIERPGEMRFSGRMIAKVRDGATLGAQRGIDGARAAEVEAGARARLAPMVIRRIEATDEYLLLLPAGESENELAARLMATGDYAYVEPDWILSPLATPNDPSFGAQWQHTVMKTALAWDTTTGSSAIICAVCDSGVDLDHPDLAPALVPGVNCAGVLPPVAQVDGGNVEDVNGHGTFVGGCMAAVGNNGVGVAGCGWSFQLMPVRVSNLASGDASLSDLTEGAVWASEHGARIMNVSYSGVSAYSVETAGATIRANGGLLFWSAGNDSANLSGFDHAHVIVVGATDSNDQRAAFSAYGLGVDLFAPGVLVYSTTLGGESGSGSGTSFSSPLAAGVAGLLWAADPMMTPDQVEQLLFDGCHDLGTPGEDSFWGHGRVDAFASMGLVPAPAGEPGGFSRVAPAAGAANTGISVHLEWTESSGAGWYEVEIDDDAGFGSPAVDAVANEAHYDVPFLTLLYNNTYHWRVTAHNLVGTTPMGGGDSTFSTGSAPLPGTFTLMYPADGATDIPLTPTMTWETSTAAAEYRVLLTDNPSTFVGAMVDVTQAWNDRDYFVEYGALTYETTYYWRVLAHNVAGWTVCSPATGSFTTVPPPVPGAFELISPAEGEADVATGPEFSWRHSANANAYLVEVAAEPGFGAPIVSDQMYAQNLGGYDTGVAAYGLADGTLPEGETLYWRVTAENTWGPTVGSPASVSFTTAPPPGCVGDVDSDGDTDIFDFAIFASNFTRSGVGPEGGDLDGDGTVTVLDFGLFAADFTCVE